MMNQHAVSYRVVEVVAGNSDAVTLSNLYPDTQYHLTVSAVWSGKKYRSRPIVFRTLGKFFHYFSTIFIFTFLMRKSYLFTTNKSLNQLFNSRMLGKLVQLLYFIKTPEILSWKARYLIFEMVLVKDGKLQCLHCFPLFLKKWLQFFIFIIIKLEKNRREKREKQWRNL